MNLSKKWFFASFLFLTYAALFAQPVWLPSNVLPATSIRVLDSLRLGYEENSKYGLMDPSGKKITPPTQKMWRAIIPGVLYAYQDPSTDTWGLANTVGQALTAPLYTQIDPNAEGYVRVQRKVVANGRAQGFEYNLVDKTGKLLLPKFYKYLGFVSEGMVAFQADSLAGFMTPLGQALIKPAFHFAKEFKGGLAPVMDAKGLWGYTDKTGKVVIPFQFNGAEPFEGQLARVTQKQSASQSLWGLVDRKGTIQAPITYKSLFAANDQGIRVASTLEYNEILLNAQGKPLNANVYDDLQVWSKEGLIRATKAGKIGYLNSLGQEVVPFLYENGYSFSEGLAAVQKDNKWGFINMAGQVVIPFQFQGAYEFQKGLSPVSRDGELCLINRQGAITMATGMPYVYFNTVLSETHLFIRLEKAILLLDAKGNFSRVLPYDEITNFSEGLAAVRKTGKWGFINTEGKEVIPLQWAGVNPFSDGIAPVQLSAGDLPYFIDKTGRKAFDLPSGYRFVGPYSEGIAKVAANNLGGYMDKTGKIAIPAKYPNLGSFVNGMAIVVNAQNKYGFIDKTGKEVIPLSFDEAGDFSADGLAPVRQGTLWGFVDKTGKMTISLQYEVVSNFKNGVCAVRKGGKVGYIDTQNKEIVPLLFEDGKEFLDDFAAVKLNGKWGFANLNGKGKLVIPANYENVGKFYENLVFVKLNGKVGAINRAGATIVPFAYEDAGEFAGGIAYVKKNGKFGIVDNNGKEIIPTVCDAAGNYQNGKIAVIVSFKGYEVRALRK